MIKISYLIALYNKSGFIVEAINSIFEDSSPEYELEVCLVDDGSMDNSLTKVRLMYGNDARVKISQFSINRGKNSAYNQAFRMSKGSFIAILGADDKVIKGRTLMLYRTCLLSGKSVYGGLVEHIDESGVERVVYPPTRVSFEENIIQGRFSGGCLMMPRRDSEIVFPIPEHLGFEDWWISFHLLRINSVTTIKKPVLFYRIHGGNDIGSHVRTYDSVRKDFERHFDYLDSFVPYLRSKKEIAYFLRSLEIRNSFFGKKHFSALAKGPFDRRWIKLFLFLLIGAKKTMFLQNKIRLIVGAQGW